MVECCVCMESYNANVMVITTCCRFFRPRGHPPACCEACMHMLHITTPPPRTHPSCPLCRANISDCFIATSSSRHLLPWSVTDYEIDLTSDEVLGDEDYMT